MTEQIGLIWQEGEHLASRGEIHDALVQFQKAKALLITESQNNYSTGQSNPRVTQILGEIMMKLTASVEKNIELMNKNPVLCLKLKKGFTKKDVKRAYRQQALKYHPGQPLLTLNKNPDCDTSCIFTAIQSAYEILLLSAPADPPHEQSQNHPPRSAGRRRDMPERESVPRSPQKAQYHSSFRRPSNSGHDAEANKPQPQPPLNSNIDREQASGVAQMSTEQIRIALTKIGFTRLEGCSREELVKKFLAAKCHFSTPSQKSSTQNYGDTWGEKMRKRMDKERQREWSREDDQTEKDRSSSQKKSSFESSKSETPPDVAILSISELKKLCVLRNISIEHCVEKSELINLLYKSYGVDHTTPSSTKESNDSKRPSSASHHNQEKSTLKRPPSSSGGIRPPPSSGTTMSGNKMHNLWTRDRLKEMEAKLRGGNRKEGKDSQKQPPRPSHEDHPFDDWTPLDAHLAEEAQKSKFMSQTSDVKTQEEELLKAQREDLPAIPKVSPERLSPSKNSPLRHIISSDSDSGSDSGDESEEIDWRPASSSHMADFRDHLPSSPSLSPSLKETFDDTKDSSFIGLNIPKHGFGDDLDDDDVEEGDDEDEESIFLNPEMTPLEIKAMRLKKFGLNYQRSLSSSSPEKGKETAFSAKNTTSLGNSKGTLHRVDVHVGVSLLDDDDDDGVESDDEQISKSLPASRSTPQKGRNGPLASPQYTNSPSATAWMHS